jgi:hypothetical protein
MKEYAKLREQASKALRVATTLNDDGAQLDAISNAARAIDLLTRAYAAKMAPPQ